MLLYSQKSFGRFILLFICLAFTAVSQQTSQPSCQPTSQPQPSTQPSYQPSSFPTSLPSFQPTSQPSYQPSTQPNYPPPTSQPSFQPSMQPSYQPSTQPNYIPSSFPTSQPSCQPTSQPSYQPTSQPSYQPTSQPSCQPSTKPSCQPSSFPSTNRPTNTANTTSLPTSQPSKQPSWEPTAQPTKEPSASPSAQPTCNPTVASSQPTSWPSGGPTTIPTSQPSSYPSSAPTSMPSPGGSLNVRWWYYVTARCDLDATSFRSDGDMSLLDTVVYAFSFALTDALNEVEREGVTVAAIQIPDSQTSRRLQSSLLTSVLTRAPSTALANLSGNIGSMDRSSQVLPPAVLHSVRVLSDEHKAYEVEAWCSDHFSATKVYNALLHMKSQEIIEPLHEKGYHEAVNSTISLVTMSTTTTPPPTLADNTLSPVRIIWIILGTLALFGIALFILSRMRYLKRLACSRTCCEDCVRHMYQSITDGCLLFLHAVGLLSSDLRLQYGSGFNLATQDEEADFYGEDRGTIPSDGLDIHYGDNRAQRSQYLEDEEDRGHSGRRSNSNSTNGKTGIEMRRFGDNDVISPIPFNSAPDLLLGESNRNNYYANKNNASYRDNPNQLAHSTSARSYRMPSYALAGSAVNAYDPLSDNIDDIGDFSTIGRQQHQQQQQQRPLVDDTTDSYESYVV